VGVFALAHPRSCRLGEQKLNELPVILLVEDDQEIQGIVEDTLSGGGFEVVIAASGEEAATLLSAPTAPTE
jgi:CheY-like chemotaxis protein